MDTQRSSAVALAALLAVATVFVFSPVVPAQTHTEDDGAYIAAVTQDDVYIRSGNSEGHYPIGKAKAGEFVRVIDVKYEWAQVQTIGPVFERFHGLVKYTERFADRLTIAPDGKSARTRGRVDIIAPNPNVRPGESWKMIARLGPNETIEILETARTERGETLHTIVLPTSARVWIKNKHLRRAEATEVAQWNRLLAGDVATDPAQTPPSPRTRNAAPAGDRVLARDTTPTPPIRESGVVAASAEDADAPPVTTNQPAAIVMQPGPETTPRPVPVRRTAARARAQQQFDELESLYARLQDEPIGNAEIDPLRELYLALAEEHAEHEIVKRYAEARAEQLEIWIELQQRRAEMDRIKKRLKLTSDEATAIRQAMNSGTDYVAIGRLSASIIYDGVKLPRLLRLQDPGTGRTIAYLQPDQEDFALSGMVGQLIGIAGDSDYDGGLRLTLITPERIDLLAPRP